MLSRKYTTSCEKRKKRKRTEEIIESQKELDKLFIKQHIENFNTNRLNENENVDDSNNEENILNDYNDNDINLDNEIDNACYESNTNVIDYEQVPILDIYDPMNWGVLDGKTRNILIEKGLLEN